jgi:hypothetical protein
VPTTRVVCLSKGVSSGSLLIEMGTSHTPKT